MESSQTMDNHASKFFWRPVNESSGSSSSGEIIDDEEHVEHEELDEEYFLDYSYGNYSNFNTGYMRNILQKVNEKWNNEPIPAQERVSKVQFLPDETLVTVAYFTDEEITDYASSIESESVQPMSTTSTEEMITLKQPVPERAQIYNVYDMVEDVGSVDEEDGFPDDFLDEDPDDDHELANANQVTQIVEKASLTSSAPGSEHFEPETRTPSLASERISKDLIDLQTDDDRSQVTGPFSAVFSDSDHEPESREMKQEIRAAAVLTDIEPAVVFNDPAVSKPDYSKYSNMFDTALEPGNSDFQQNNLSSSSSSESISTVSSTDAKDVTTKSPSAAKATNKASTKASTESKLSQIEKEVSAEVARLHESLKNNNNPEPEPVKPPPSSTSNTAVELIKKFSAQRLKTSGSLEITGMKLHPEVALVAAAAEVAVKTSIKSSPAATRPRTQKMHSLSDLSQTSSTKITAVAKCASVDETEFQEVIKSVFNKKALSSLNKLCDTDPKRLHIAKSHIADRKITRAMLINVFQPEIVRLLLDDDQPPASPRQNAVSKWATRPVYNLGVGHAAANADAGIAKEKPLPTLKRPPFITSSVTPAPSPMQKVAPKKKRSDESKAKASVPSRSVSAKEKVSAKLRSTIGKLSPRPATTGSKSMNRVSDQSGIRLNSSEQNINNTIVEKIRLENEKKRANFHHLNGWTGTDKKKKESPPKRPATVPVEPTQTDPWLIRLKHDSKKMENQILSKIDVENNPRMMDAYRAYTFGGPNPTPPSMALAYAQKMKSLGHKSSFTHH